MFRREEFHIGQLVEYKVWPDRDGSWAFIDRQIGIVIDIFRVHDDMFDEDSCIKIYDIKIYWIVEEVIEVIPDFLIRSFDSEPETV